MGSNETAALVTTVVLFCLVIRRIPRHGSPSMVLGLFALLGEDARYGRPGYLLLAGLLGAGLGFWALRIFHLLFFGNATTGYGRPFPERLFGCWPAPHSEATHGKALRIQLRLSNMVRTRVAATS